MRKPDLILAKQWASNIGEPTREQLMEMLGHVADFAIELERSVNKSITDLAKGVYGGGEKT